MESTSEGPKTPIVMPIVSFAELSYAIETLRSREEEDKLKLLKIGELTGDDIRGKLMNWAMLGFPNTYAFYTLQFATLDTCSDGVARPDVFQYIEFLQPGFSLTNALSVLEEKLPGMQITYSYTKNLTLYIHVSKKE